MAVISYRYWQRRFAQNSTVVGQSIVLNNTPFTIIGVAPSEFFGVIVGSAPDVFLPSVIGERILPRRSKFLDDSLPFVLARLKPEVTAQQSNAELCLLLRQAALAEAGSELTPEKQQASER